jgi:hypothetical protein
MSAWARRREARDRIRAAERARAFEASALAHGPNEQARLVPTPEHVEVVLPVPRFVLLTDAGYEESRRWWSRLENPSAAQGLAIRIRREIRDGARKQRETARSAAAWRLKQRAFERAQRRAVIAHRNSRPAGRRASQWIAIDQDRALAIAKAVLTSLHFPVDPTGKQRRRGVHHTALVDEHTAGLAASIGARERRERAGRSWTLDRLAETAGVGSSNTDTRVCRSVSRVRTTWSQKSPPGWGRPRSPVPAVRGPEFGAVTE